MSEIEALKHIRDEMTALMDYLANLPADVLLGDGIEDDLVTALLEVRIKCRKRLAAIAASPNTPA
jgi:hypothetical protein